MAERAAALTAAIALAGLGDSYSLERVALVAPLVEEAPPSLLQLVQRMRRHGLEPRDLLCELDPIVDGGTVVDPLPRRSYFALDDTTGVVRYRGEIVYKFKSERKRTMLRALMEAKTPFEGDKDLFIHLNRQVPRVWTVALHPRPSSWGSQARALATDYGALDDQLVEVVNATHARLGLRSVEEVLLRDVKVKGFAYG